MLFSSKVGRGHEKRVVSLGVGSDSAGVRGVYLAMAVWTFYNLPPIPDKVVTKSGAVLFTGNGVIEGKRLAQKYDQNTFKHCFV